MSGAPAAGSYRRRISKVQSILRNLGLLNTARLLLRVVQIACKARPLRRHRERRFDALYGVRTAGFRSLADLGLGGQEAASHNYEGTDPMLFDAAMRELDISWPRFEFIDYGSGMGKSLLLAARLPFRQVTGIEFSPELHAVAERNIAAWRLPLQRCFAVRSIMADAATWPLPKGDCILFFFNPFREDLLRRVLGSIVAAVDSGREVYLVYLRPSYASVFAEFPRLKRIAGLSLYYRFYEIYRVMPPGA